MPARYGNLANGEMPDQIYGVSWNGEEKVNYTYDSLGRLTNKVVGGNIPQPFNTTYSYVDVDDTKTTTLLSSMTTTNLIYNELFPDLNSATYNYEYDELGNITSIEFFDFETTYEYDELNQLVRENDEKSDVTYTYEYVNGNIKYKHQYAYTTGTLPATPQKTTEYHYEDNTWSDVLTKITETTYSSTNTSTASTYSVGAIHESSATNSLADFLFGNNCNTVDLTENAIINVGDNLGVPNMNTYSLNSNSTTLFTIGSDEIGNITNIGNVTMDWNGRRLESISQSGTELVSYEYNMDGQRVKKTVTDPTTNTTKTTEYFYNGSILAGQKAGNDTIIFMYDNNGDIFGFTYNGTPYYYVKNAQNDVVFIVDETNHIVVYYEYDAWGKVIYCNDISGFGLASINPIMYRSYYVDLEMGMYIYYLNSRYYIADWGRFASGDSVVSGVGQEPLGYNMFAYCMNNPINMSDEDGNWPKWIETVISAVKNFVDKTISYVKSATSSANNIQVSKKATNRPDSGLIGESDEEIQRKARDKSLSGKERNRYREEEKVRGLRNKQKRQSNITPEQFGQIVCGTAIVVVAVVGITYVAANDVTGVGAADDAFLVPLISLFNQGTILIFQTG